MFEQQKIIVAQTKRDNTVMKVIAVLSALLLPGTFIAVSEISTLSRERGFSDAKSRLSSAFPSSTGTKKIPMVHILRHIGILQRLSQRFWL
jgi:hypothetical protein